MKTKHLTLVILLLFQITFLCSLTIPLPRFIYSIDTGDIDQNGMLDMVVGHFSINSPRPAFTTIYNFQDGAFSLIDSSLAFTGYQSNISLAKLNNDLFPDLISFYADYTAGNGVPYMRLFANQNGLFGSTFTDIPYLSEHMFSKYIVGDFNGDEFSDIAFYDGWSDVSFMMNDGPFQYSPLIQFQRSYPPQQMKSGDLDNDGLDELLIVGQHMTIYDLAETVWHQTIVDTLHFHSIGFISDVDNDGANEIVTQEIQGGMQSPIRVYKKVGDDYIMVYEHIYNIMGNLLVFDYNNDNLPDLLIGNCLETNLGNYNFSETQLSFPGLYSFHRTCGDIDGNGYLDIIFIGNNESNGLVNIYFGNGIGDFYDNPVATTDESLPSQQYESITIAYPNPMSSQINFRFIETTPKHYSKIYIYNVKGQLIWQTVVTDKQAVWNRIDKSGQRVAQGVYYCRIESIDKRVTAQKILVID